MSSSDEAEPSALRRMLQRKSRGSDSPGAEPTLKTRSKRKRVVKPEPQNSTKPPQEDLQPITVCMDTQADVSNHLLQNSAHIQQKQQSIINMARKMGGLQLGKTRVQHLIQDSTAQLEENSLLSDSVNDMTEQDVLQRIQRVSEMLTHAPHNNISPKSYADSLNLRNNTSILRREWEERFLHEPSGCERACCNRATNSCFASMIENHGILDPNFALCEFYTETEYTQIEKSGWQWPEELRPCLLCLRNMIFYQFMQARCNSTSVLPSINFACIGNLVNVKGEYCTENCFLSRPERYEGLLAPVVIPNVLDYKVVTTAGIRHLQQLLPYPEGMRPNFFF